MPWQEQVMRLRLTLAVFLVLVTCVDAQQTVHAHGTPSEASLCHQQPDGASCAQIMDALVAELPAPPAILAMARITLGPGVQFPGLAVPGPALLLVDTGTLTIDMQGETDESEYIDELEGFVQRAAVNGTPVPATGSVEVASFGTFRITLNAGDRMLIPGDWPHAMRNDTGAPISVLAVAVTPPEPETGGPQWPPAGAWPPKLPDGVTVQSMDAGYRVSTDLPKAQGTEILLERVEMQPSASLTLEEGSPRLLTVVDGRLTLTCTAACPVRQAGSTATPIATGSPGATPVGEDGVQVILGPGESALVPIDVHATVSTGGLSGNQAVSFLSVTVAPSDETPGKQHEH
jgi:hypothetical protein